MTKMKRARNLRRQTQRARRDCQKASESKNNIKELQTKVTEEFKDLFQLIKTVKEFRERSRLNSKQIPIQKLKASEVLLEKLTGERS